MKRMKECKCCSRSPVGLFYKGLTCWGYYCAIHAAHYGLTPVLGAIARPIQAASASA